jgi:uncharacterized protein with FMN-binding domain
MKLLSRSILLAASVAQLSGVSLAAPLDPSGVLAPVGQTAAAQPARATKGIADGSYTGPAVDAYWGLVQVKANIQGGKLVSVDVLKYPSGKNTSRRINRYALPVLEQEVVSAQSSNVNLVSGATLTSRAYLRSLSGAIAKSAG